MSSFIDRYRCLTCVLILGPVLYCGAAAQGQKAFRVHDGGFERNGVQGWTAWSTRPGAERDLAFSVIEGEAHEGARFLTIRSDTGRDGTYLFLTKTISDRLPLLKFVRLTGYVRTTSEAGILLEASSRGKPLGGEASMPRNAPRDGRWNRVELKAFVPMGADGLTVTCYLRGKGEAAFDDFALEIIPYDLATSATLLGPGIATAHGAADFKATNDLAKLEVVIPLAVVTPYQTPISFQMSVDPPSKLVSSTVFNRMGSNWNARVVFGPLKKGEVVRFRYWSDVVLAAADFGAIPKTLAIPPRAGYPQDVLPWLEPTVSVQSNDARIVQQAEKLMTAAQGDAATYINGVLVFLRTIKRDADAYKRVDAVEMLEHGGFCTSYANLAAALLRAAGIPVRVIGNYPTWNVALYTHYIVEVYLAGIGWVPAESMQGRFPYQPFNQVYVSIAGIQDENDSFGDDRETGGVPKWSLFEISPRTGVERVNSPLGNKDCDHIAYPKAQYPAEADLSVVLDKARRIWGAYLADKTGKAAHRALVATMETRLTDAPATVADLAAYLSGLERMIERK